MILFLAPYFSVATFGQEESSSGTGDKMLDEILQYCRFIHYGMNNGKEDIKGDLLDTGNITISPFLKVPKTCDEAKDAKQDMENFKNM
jgi:hypothetical protein